MADISAEIAEIRNAVYGEEVRQSLIDGLTKINSDNESYQDIKNEIKSDKQAIESIIDGFHDQVDDLVSDYLDNHQEIYTGYTKAETAEILRNRMPSVKDYGAKGDGVTDDTESICRAILSNFIVYFPSGIYKTGNISINKTVSLIGEGRKTVLKSNGNLTENTPLITVLADSCSLSKMTIIGADADGNTHAGLAIGNENSNIIHEAIIDKVFVISAGGYGIYLTSSSENCIISNSSITSCKDSGIKVWGVGHAISNVTCQQNVGSGIELWQGGQHITNFRCWGNYNSGLRVIGAKNTVIVNGELQQNRIHGLKIETDTDNNRRSQFNTISNIKTIGNNHMPLNQLVDNQGCGFVIEGDYNIIKGFDTMAKELSGSWLACENYSLLMPDAMSIGNTIDIKTTTGEANDFYKVLFNNNTILTEPHKAKLEINNPFNQITIDGQPITTPSMTNATYNSNRDSSADGITVTKGTGGWKEITLNGVQSSSMFDFEQAYSNGSFLYRQGFDVSYQTGKTKLYVKLTAKVNAFRKWGIIPIIQQSWTRSGGSNATISHSMSESELKANCIFSSDYTTKEFVIDLDEGIKYVNRNGGTLGGIIPRLLFVKLTDNNDETAEFQINEFSVSYGDDETTIN